MEAVVTMQSFYKGKKVFITGHTGFKGSWLCLMLKELGAEIYGYSDAVPTNPSMFELLQLDTLINQDERGNVADYEHLNKALIAARPDIVFHLAAQPLVRKSYEFPKETFMTNVMGTVNFLEAVRAIPTVKAAVVITTDKVYKNQEWYWGYRENDALGSNDPYATSKAAAELVAECYQKNFCQHIATARAGNVIGGGDFAADRLIPDFLRSIEKQEPLVLRNPAAVRPWQFVCEPLYGYLTLAMMLFSKGKQYSGAWNFGPSAGNFLDVESITKMICHKFDANYLVAKQENAPEESKFLTLDSSKAARELGWHSLLLPKQTIDLIGDWTKCYQSSGDLLGLSTQQVHDYLELAKSI